MRVFESGTVLHGYPRVMPEDPGIEVTGARAYAQVHGYLICICLKEKLTGIPDPRVIRLAAGPGS